MFVDSLMEDHRDDGSLGGKGAGKGSGNLVIGLILAVLLFLGAGPINGALCHKPNTTAPEEEIFKLSLHAVNNSLDKLLSSWPESLKNGGLKSAFDVCGSVIDDAIGMLNDSISLMEVNSGGKVDAPKSEDLKTWLSTAITDQQACLDAFREQNRTVPVYLKALLKNSTKYASNSLAIVSMTMGSDKKLLGESGSGFPYWVGAEDRRLLHEVNPRPHVTVALDGSGDFKTITEALGKVPTKSTRRFVIYVKKGKYFENAILDRSLWNVMIYGDGIGKTIVSGGLNLVDGTPTYFTATFAAVGRGFIAKDITFRNTAGAEKYQAVAFRSGSDHSIFYRSSFEGFQNTLYIHSNRQLYIECNITGTIDLIFGNAASVFESCNIILRQPLLSQILTITAQGKTDPNQNTGISIQKSAIYPPNDPTAPSSAVHTPNHPSAPTFLGRPCKEYSTTVIMQTHIGSFLDPKGWIECVSSVIPPSTIFYAEYQNTGPGARVDKRVTWSGYKANITADQANKFAVESFV